MIREGVDNTLSECYAGRSGLHPLQDAIHGMKIRLAGVISNAQGSEGFIITLNPYSHS